MKKSYFSLAVIFVLFLGIWKMQFPMHNQEVVLQFEDQKIELKSKQGIVKAIKEQLSKHGVGNPQVYENENGVLKITYYSEDGVEVIKETLEAFLIAAQHTTESESNNEKEEFFVNFSKGQEEYKLDVFEIQEGSNGTSGLGGKFAIIISDEFSKPSAPETLTTLNKRSAWKYNTQANLSSNISGKQSNYIDNISYLIPDVRAGPNFI